MLLPPSNAVHTYGPNTDTTTFAALQAPHEVLWTAQNHGLVSVSVALPYCIVLLHSIAVLDCFVQACTV